MVAGLRLRLSDAFLGVRLHVPNTDIVLRYPSISHFDEWRKIRSESRTFLERWEPRWPPDDLTRIGFHRRLKSYAKQRNEGTGKTFFIFDQGTVGLVGGLGLTRISRRGTHSAMLGYWMASRHAGKGYMQRAVATIMQHAFEDMELDKLEAASVPGNSRSIHILEKSGFERERYEKEFLDIN